MICVELLSRWMKDGDTDRSDKEKENQKKV